MINFTLDIKTKGYFGEHIVKEALSKEKTLLGKNIYIVSTGRSLERNGYISELLDYIKEIVPNGTVHLWTQVSANPDIDEIAKAINYVNGCEIDSVIGFGGGSALDAAKAVAIGLESDEDITKIYQEGKEQSNRKCKLFAIPTTAGTGSELSKAAIVSSRKNKTKGGIRGGGLIPDVAIVDPTYTYSVPKRITAETGFDVLAHAVESYVAVKSNIFSEMLSETAIRKVGENLPKLINNIDDKDARREISFASMLMGLNLKDVGTGLPHRMQYPLGSLSESSHGAGLIALYPSWIKHEYDVSREKIGRVISILGYSYISTAEEARGCIEDYIKRIDAKITIKELGIHGVNEYDLASMVSGNIKNDPLGEQDKIIETIYKEALDG